MIIGQRVKVVCDECGLETHAEVRLMANGHWAPLLPHGWQGLAPGKDGKPVAGPLGTFCELHHRKLDGGGRVG